MSSSVFVFHTQRHGGIEVFLIEQRLYFRIIGGEYSIPGSQQLHDAIEVCEIDYEVPYMLGIDHQKRLMRRSFTLTLNGKEIIKDASIDLPKVPSSALLTKASLFERFTGKVFSVIISSGGSISPQNQLVLFENLKEGIQCKKNLKMALFNTQKITKTLSIFTPISCQTNKAFIQDLVNAKFMGKLPTQGGVVTKDSAKMHLNQYRGFSPIISLLLLLCEEKNEKELPKNVNLFLQLLSLVLKKPKENQLEAVSCSLFSQISAILQSIPHPVFDEESIELLAELRVSLIDERLNMDLFMGVLLNKNIYPKLPFDVQISLFRYLRTIYNEHAALYVRHFDVGHLVRDITSFLNESTQKLEEAEPEEAEKTKELCRVMFDILEGIFFSTKGEVLEAIPDILKQLIHKTSNFLKIEFLALIEKIIIEKKKQSEHFYLKIMEIFTVNRGIELFLDVALNSRTCRIQTKCVQFISLLASHTSHQKNPDSSDSALKYFCIFAQEKIKNFEKIKKCGEEDNAKGKSGLSTINDPSSVRIGRRRLSDIIDGSPKARDVLPSNQVIFMDDAALPQATSLSRGKREKFVFKISADSSPAQEAEETKEEKQAKDQETRPKGTKGLTFKDKKRRICLDIEAIEADNPVGTSGDAMRERATPRTLARQKGEIFELAAELANALRAGTKNPASPFSKNKEENEENPFKKDSGSEKESEEEEEESFELGPLPQKVHRPPKAIPQSTKNSNTLNFSQKPQPPLTQGIVDTQKEKSEMAFPKKIKKKQLFCMDQKQVELIPDAPKTQKDQLPNSSTNREPKTTQKQHHQIHSPFEITEELYTAIMKWGLNKGNIPFDSVCIVDESDSIEHPGAIVLLIVLCNNTKSPSLKQQLLIDLSLLFQYSYSNTKVVLEEMPSFLDWLLDTALEAKEGEQNMDALLERTTVVTLCSCLKSDPAGLELASSCIAWIESKVVKKEPKRAVIAAQSLTKRLFQKTLSSLLDQAQSMFPLSVISPFWRNIIRFVFLVFDLVFVNPPVLSQNEKELSEFPWSSLNNGVLERLRPYISIENEEWADASLLSSLIKIGEFFWKDSLFSSRMKNSKDISALSKKISALLDASLKRQFASEFDMLMKCHDMPFQSPLRWIQVILFSHCALIEYELSQIKSMKKPESLSSFDSISKLVQSFEKMVNYFLVLSENSTEANSTLSDSTQAQSKFMIGFVLSSMGFLLEQSTNNDLPPQITSMFKGALQSIFIYLMLIIDSLQAKHRTFTKYPEIQQTIGSAMNPKKRKGLGQQNEPRLSWSYSLITHEIIWEFMKMPNGEPMISEDSIKTMKSGDFHELETILVSGSLRRSLLKNEKTLALIAEALRYSPIEEINKMIKAFRMALDEKTLVDEIQKKKNKSSRNQFETKMTELHEKCVRQITNKEGTDETLQRITVHRALAVVKRLFNEEHLYNGFFSPGPSFFQNSVAFRANLWSFEQMKPKNFKRSLKSIQTKTKARPFLKFTSGEALKLFGKSVELSPQGSGEKTKDEDILNPLHVFRLEKPKNEPKEQSTAAGMGQNASSSQSESQTNSVSSHKNERKMKDPEGKIKIIGKSIVKALMPTIETTSPSTKDGQVKPVVESDRRFKVKAIYECEMAKTLTLSRGYFAISKSRLYFLHHSIVQSKSFRALKESKLTKWDQLLKIWPMNFVKDLQVRRFLMKKTGFEVFFIDGKSLLINLKTEAALNEFFEFVVLHKRFFPNLVYHKTFSPSRLPELSGATRRWQERSISNFEYLAILNHLASRSYLDISQFPVFPWVLGVSSSPSLSLSNTENFRDLSKPMGALGHERRKQIFLERFESEDPFNPGYSYHYGSHYSNPAIICQYMIRMDPYTSGGIEIQNGNFDLPDRIFASIDEGFRGATEEPSDVRELIPEFFCLPEFLLNLEKHDFGLSQTKQRVHHIALPKWAKENPYVFVAFMRKALESEYVSGNLHAWIDLVFGFKQFGEEAVKEMNMFYPSTYDQVYNEKCLKAVDMEAIEAREAQLFHFGQTPMNIFSKPHVKRGAKAAVYRTVVEIGAQMTIYKPKMLNMKENGEMSGGEASHFNWFKLPPKANVLMKFLSDKAILVMKRSGRLQLYRWWNSSIDRVPEDRSKMAFTNGLEVDDVTLRLEDTSFDHILLFDRTVYCTHPPAAILDNGKKLLIGGYWEGKMAIYSIESGFLLKIYSRSKSTVTAMEMDAKQNFVVSGSASGETIVWKIGPESTLVVRSVSHNHSQEISSISISLELLCFATAARDGLVCIYNLFNGNLIRVLTHPESLPISQVVLSASPIASVVFFSQKDKSFFSFSVNGQLLERVIGDYSFVTSPLVEKDPLLTDMLIYGNDNGEIHIRELPYLEKRSKYEVTSGKIPPICLAVNGDKRYLLTSGVEGEIFILGDSRLINQAGSDNLV